MTLQAIRRQVVRGKSVSPGWVWVVATAVLAWSGLFGESAVSAAGTAPAWSVTVAGVPSILPSGAGKHGKFNLIVENVGGAPNEEEAIIRDVLPPGLIATNAGGICAGEGTGEVQCPVGSVAPGGFVIIYVEFEESEPLPAGEQLLNTVTVSGGGAKTVKSEDSIRVAANGEKLPGPGGIAHFSMSATDFAGEPAAQAAGHPNFLTTAVIFNSRYFEPAEFPAKPVESTKDLVFYLPLGLIGNPTVAEQCPVSVVEVQGELSGCPPGSRLGSVVPMLLGVRFTFPHGLYNVIPEKGYAAEFAFTSNNMLFTSYASVVRRNGTYMVRVDTPGVPAGSALIGLVASFDGDIQEHFFNAPENETTFDRGAFLTNPTDCTESAEAGRAEVAVDTWDHPDASLPLRATSTVYPSLTGCELLNFATGLDMQPETTQADAPSGYDVGVEVPQAPNAFSGLGTPPVKDAKVVLPEGVTVSPSSANGLEACEETGPRGIDIEGPESEEVAEDGLARPASGHCPAASQIATVKASSPLLREELTGRMFLATPECGQGAQGCTSDDAEDGKLVGLYLELEGPHSGVVVKFKGHAKIAAGTGEITTTFEGLPQFPLSNVVVTTKHGARAPLANPQRCGPTSGTATLTSWSPQTPPAEASSGLAVDWNGAGQSCPASAPFAPAFTAGTTSPTAASTSPFTLTLKREDREQNIATLSTTLPEGLLANISKVTRCPEPQASQDSLSACPASSQIGTTTVAVGPGNDPYYVQGKVFFTGPYGGAPFGLSVVVPAVAGPFNLGNVLVRAKLLVDPHTAQATAVSDPLPQELDGIPLRMRVLNITLTNEDFVLNPTNCQRMSINATATSTTGATASLSSPFTAKGCNKLAFKPKFSASTEAKATKANGTGVKLKIAYPSSGEANIAKTVLGFPKKLPVRLETLQKACLAATFEANPASCPAASNVGTATVHTPILSSPLTGPIYLVSYGNAKFPDAVIVLQGEGLTLDVHGQSFVSKAGALTATFASVPDAPFSTFEATLPAGPFSQFTSVKTSGKAQGSQCGENLLVPVTMVAHNGAQLKESVAMQIAGCRPSVSIQGARLAGGRLAVTVKTSVKGRLTIHGAGVKTLAKPGLAAGTHKLTIALTAAGRAAARAHRKIGLTVGLVAGKHKTKTHKKVAL